MIIWIFFVYSSAFVKYRFRILFFDCRSNNFFIVFYILEIFNDFFFFLMFYLDREKFWIVSVNRNNGIFASFQYVFQYIGLIFKNLILRYSFINYNILIAFEWQSMFFYNLIFCLSFIVNVKLLSKLKKIYIAQT